MCILHQNTAVLSGYIRIHREDTSKCDVPGYKSGYVRIRSARAYRAFAKLGLLALHAKGLEALLLLISCGRGCHRSANKGRRRTHTITTAGRLP